MSERELKALGLKAGTGARVWMWPPKFTLPQESLNVWWLLAFYCSDRIPRINKEGRGFVWLVLFLILWLTVSEGSVYGQLSLLS